MAASTTGTTRAVLASTAASSWATSGTGGRAGAAQAAGVIIPDAPTEAGEERPIVDVVDVAAIAKAKVTYTVTLASGGTEDRTEAVQVRIRTTDATTANYTTLTDYQAPEPVPSGLAER